MYVSKIGYYLFFNILQSFWKDSDLLDFIRMVKGISVW